MDAGQRGTDRLRSGGRRAAERQELERRNVSTVHEHLALVAVEGATDGATHLLAPDFTLYLDGVTTDRSGYLALIEANDALSSGHATLIVRSAVACGDFVTVSLRPTCVAHFQLTDGLISRAWMTSDRDVWTAWLKRYHMT
jgi:hypothetical protein